MKLQTTNQLQQRTVNILVYGAAGAGKTSLIPTLPAPIILSAEGGLLSIQESELPFIEIDSMATLQDAYMWLASSEETKQYQTVAIDSISEVAEVCLADEKSKTKDPRKAYGEMQDLMAQIIRAFRDLPRHVYMTAKLEKSQDEMGRVLYAPAMPGAKTGQSLPYFFDEVLALRVEKDSDGNIQRFLQTQGDGLWLAKDRSGKLEAWEFPDLGDVIRKIVG